MAGEWKRGGAVEFVLSYYPGDTRNVSDNTQKLSIAVGTDAFSQVLKEFWPDIKRKLVKKKS